MSRLPTGQLRLRFELHPEQPEDLQTAWHPVDGLNSGVSSLTDSAFSNVGTGSNDNVSSLASGVSLCFVSNHRAHSRPCTDNSQCQQQPNHKCFHGDCLDCHDRSSLLDKTISDRVDRLKLNALVYKKLRQKPPTCMKNLHPADPWQLCKSESLWLSTNTLGKVACCCICRSILS